MTELFNSNINDIQTSRVNLVKQLKKAGYNVSAYEEITLNELYYMGQNNQLDFKVNNDMGNTINIKYFISKPIKATTIQTLTSELFSEEGFDPYSNIIILIVENEPNVSVQDVIKQLYAEENIYFIIYNIKRLLFNIHEHKFVPNHRIMTQDEEKTMFEKYSITNPKSELPTISRFDPVSLAIFIKPGQICEITRSTINGINGYYYRLCVNS
tara:strand:- start:290 stop:925 length:636 start_codon:yes stop_codon:yes gene_type:complete